MNKLAKDNFDYSLVDADAKGKLIRWAADVGKENGKVVEAYVERGRIFAEAQKELAKPGRNGLFSKWVETECNVSKRTAYNLINVFEVFGNCATVAQFRPNVLLALSKETTPEEAIKDAIKASKKGPVTPEMADAFIDKYTVESEPEAPADGAVEEEFNQIIDTHPSEMLGGADEPVDEPQVDYSPEQHSQEDDTPDWRQIKKATKQYAEYAQRGIDDLNRVRPHESHDKAVELCSELIRLVGAW